MSEKTIPEQIVEELLKKQESEIAGEIKPVSLTKKAKSAVKKNDPKVKSPTIKEKTYYDVRVECMLPATLTFRVLAEEPAQAADLIRGMSPVSVKHKLIGRKDIKLSVYDAGTSFLRWAKNLIGM